MWARIEIGKVAEITETDPSGRFHPSLSWAKCGEKTVPGMLYAGGKFLNAPAPVATKEQVIASAVSAVQFHLDAAAKSLGYDDIKTAVTYADEPAVPKFQADGQALRAWRSLVWAHAYATLDAVEDGEREQPTIEEFIAELPEFVLAYD